MCFPLYIYKINFYLIIKIKFYFISGCYKMFAVKIHKKLLCRKHFHSIFSNIPKLKIFPFNKLIGLV